jgi:uncharacterized SAM-binding protein YcdF (DUF218 family)
MLAEQVAGIVVSVLLGAVIGLISVAIFAVTLRRLSEKKPNDATKALTVLVATILGGGGLNYLADEFIFSSSAGSLGYFGGLAAIFLPFGIVILIQWLRQ